MGGNRPKTAIILAGGLGLRLRPYTEHDPKPMVKIGDKPLAEWQVRWLRHHSVERIIFAVGHRWERIQEYFGDGEGFGIRAQYSVEEEPLGTGGGLRRASELVEEDTFIVVNGDVLTDLDLGSMIDWHLRLGVLGTIAVVPYVSPFGIVQVSPMGKVMGFVEKPTIPNTYINGGVYVLTKEIANRMPNRGDLESTAFPSLASEGLLGAYLHEGYWRSVDTIKDLKALQKEASSWSDMVGRGGKA